MAEIELINHGSYEFIDISNEITRTYIFPGDEEVTVNGVQWLAVSKSGHRLLDADGISHFIPYTWIHLMWTAKDGKPHFVK